jgi:hypothetical protein
MEGHSEGACEPTVEAHTSSILVGRPRVSEHPGSLAGGGHGISVAMPTRKERIRSLDRHTSSFALSWAARGGDAVCGKLVNEIVGLAERHQ